MFKDWGCRAKLYEWKQGVRGDMSHRVWLPTCINFNSMKFLPNIHSSCGSSLTWIYYRLAAQGSANTSKDEFPHFIIKMFARCIFYEVHVIVSYSLCCGLLFVLWLCRYPVAVVGGGMNVERISTRVLKFPPCLLDRAASQSRPSDQPLSSWKDILHSL